MGKFNSDDLYIYYCGQESLKRNGVVLIVNKELEMQYLGAISKMTEWCWFISKESQFNITVIHVCAPTTDAEEAEVDQFYEHLQDLLEPTLKKDVLFIIGDWNVKVRSRETPGVRGKFGFGVQNEAGQRLTQFCQENALETTPSSNNTRDDSTRGHHQMVNTEIRLIIFFAAEDGEALYIKQNKTRSWLWFRSWTPYCKI